MMYFIANAFRSPIRNSKSVLWRRFMALSSCISNACVTRTSSVPCIWKPYSAATCRSSPTSLNTNYNVYSIDTILSTKYHNQADATSNRCSCCGLNTKGDLELAEFLKLELKFEKECAAKQSDVPTINGFKLSSQKGPWITLTKRLSNEIIRVKFNVMDSLHSSELDNDEIDELSVDEDYLLDYLPPFVVEIEKDDLDNCLVLHCIYQATIDEGFVKQEIDKDFATIEIHRAALAKKPNTSWREDVFYLSELCDTLHDHLLRMLRERGIDRHFSRELVELKQIIEHQCYITLLEQLSDFALSRPQARNWTCEWNE